MVDAIISFAIEKLSDFIIKEVNIRIGVKEAVGWLKDELGFLLICVRAAEAKKQILSVIENEQIGLWINSIKDVANRAVIILDRFSVYQEEHAVPKKGVIYRMQSFICICSKEAGLYDFGNEIESLKEKICDIKNRRDEYGIRDILATPMVKQRKRTLLRATSFQNNVDVVGFEDDVQTLLAKLNNQDPSLGLLSIHGMGGLGKSTLAGKLYHSNELSHYKSRAWVCVSEDYDIVLVLKKIIKCFMGDELDSLNKMEEVDLLRHLRKILLDGDHYLAVIDDIWDIEVWKKIKDAFPDKKNSSRIIITTRNKEVAHGVDDRCFAHELRFLREDESWELFCKGANPTRNLDELGRAMIAKCGGLPLAIVVLSGLLVDKSYEDWSKVNDHLWRRLKGKSVEIQEILSLSYDDLSFQMRQCFLYVARFPEDHTFNVQKLMRLWVAEEFISDTGRDGKIMEDVAEDYLNELISRNLFQIATLHWHGGVNECRVHDLVRDLATQKATEDKLLGVFDSSKQHPSHVHLLQEQPRLAVYNGIGEYLELLGSSSDNLMLRSVALIYTSQKLFKLEEMKLTCTRFINLKVLDLNSVESQRLPQEIGDLVLLKFLGLTRSYGYPSYVVIPASIGKLKKLQTLCGSDGITYTFPREICELKELRHLGCLSYDVGRLNISSCQRKLQTLGTIEYNEWIQIDTLSWTNLHALCITVDGVQKEQGGNFVHNLDSIANLTSLQSFTFYFFTVPSDVYQVCYGVPYEITTRVIATLKPLSSCKRLKDVYLYGEIRDPSELRFLPHSVTNLKLKGSRFREDPLATLGDLPNLTSLILDEVYLGKKVMCSNDAFPSLHLFYLKNMPRLEELQVDDRALLFLKTFRKYNCIMLKVPPRIKCIAGIPDIYII